MSRSTVTTIEISPPSGGENVADQVSQRSSVVCRYINRNKMRNKIMAQKKNPATKAIAI